MLKVDVQLAWAAPVTRAELRRFARAGAAADGPHAGAMTVRLVGAAESAALNRAHRGKDRPANVLSFPGPDPAWLPPDEPRPLGDVVICAPCAREEALQYGKTEAARLAHLVVHGVLHLLGHDHHAPAERRRMEALERTALAKLGFPDPYRADSAALVPA